MSLGSVQIVLGSKHARMTYLKMRRRKVKPQPTRYLALETEKEEEKGMAVD